MNASVVGCYILFLGAILVLFVVGIATIRSGSNSCLGGLSLLAALAVGAVFLSWVKYRYGERYRIPLPPQEKDDGKY